MATIYNNDDNGDWLWHLIVFWIFAIFFALCIMLCGCKSVKYVPIVKHDSVRVDTRYIRYTEKDTVFVEIPAQMAERTTRDSASHLENDFAVSDARINADGTLFHNLSTKPQKKPIEVEKEIVNNDSIVYIGNISRETGQQILEVEKPLTWWQKTRIYGCYLFGLLLVISYRKEIWSVIKRFIFRALHPTG